MLRAFICEGCKRAHEAWDSIAASAWIFNCQYCETEICDCCMHGYATCKKCASVHTEEEIRIKFEEERE